MSVECTQNMSRKKISYKFTQFLQGVSIYICQIYFNRRILATICTCEGWVDKNIIMKIKISLEILHSIL